MNYTTALFKSALFLVLVMHPMTTAALQQNYPQVYEQFFHEHDLVLSLPLQFRRVHDTPMWSDSLLIKQQLPTKIYLWLTPQKRSGVFFESAWIFDLQNWFAKQSIEDVVTYDKIVLLQSNLIQLLHNLGYSHWVKCSILTEQLKWYGFGFMWILCASLTCACYILAGKLTKEQLHEANFSQTKLFQEIVRCSIELDTAIGWSPTWISAYLSLAHISQPVIQFGSASTLSMQWIVSTTDQEQVITSLSALFGLDETPSFPVDYGIISLGLACDEQEMKFWALHCVRSYKEIYSYWKVLQDRLCLPDSMNIPEEFPMKIVGKSLKISLLQSREWMLKNPLNTLYTEAFIQRIWHVGSHAVFLEQQEQQLIDMYNQFNLSKKSTRENIWLVPMSTIRAWWLIMFVCHKWKSRQTIDDMIKELRIQGYENMHGTYLSWRDGVGGSWCAVEQRLSKGIYSKYISRWSMIIITAQWVKRILSPEDLLESSNKNWVILDQTNWKVRFPNIKLTHKDLPSQPWTIEIIGKLIECHGKFIHNSDFSCSSYSKNKNEMMGKIIHPMVRLVKSHFGQELEIECKGSLFDFSLRLTDDKGLLSLVKQLGK